MQPVPASHDRIAITCLRVAAFGTAGAALAGADVALGAPELVASAVASGAAIGFVLGALLGAAIALVFALLERAPGAAAFAVWAAFGCTVTAFVVDRLGLLARLTGRYAETAWLLLLGAVASGVVVLLAGMAVQPRPGRPFGFAFASARRRGFALAAAVAVLAIGIALDRLVWPDGYVEAHRGLRRALVVLAGCAALLLATAYLPHAFRKRKARAALGCALLAAAVPFAWLDQQHRALHALLSAPIASELLLFARELGDFDGDGHAAWLGGRDCAPFDARIHPAARERPGNGVDDNCRLGDAAQAAPAPAASSPPATRSPASVVLVTIDTLRADRTSAYDPQLATTPQLKAFARTALRFERAYTSGGWTSLALPSLFRGVYARRLRWTRLFETNRYRLLRAAQVASGLRSGERVRKCFALPLADPRPPFTILLQRRGVFTAAVADDSYTEYFDAKLGAFPGFDRFVDIDRLPKRRRNDAGVTDEALRVLAAMPKDRTFFLWVHYFGPHSPSKRRPGVPRFGPGSLGAYDHEVAYTDRELGRLLDGLRVLEHQRPLAILVTADHGEEFGSTGRHHGQSLREPAIRIPLLFKAKGVQPGTCSVPVSLVDVVPTVLSLTGTPAPAHLDGLDLARVAAQPDAAMRRVLFADTWRFDRSGKVTMDKVAAIRGAMKLTDDTLHWHRVPYAIEGFGERIDFSLDARPLAAELERYLEATGPPLVEP